MDLGGMGLRDHRADPRALVQRITEGHLSGDVEQPLHQRIAEALLNEKPASRDAALAGIVVDAIGDAVGGRVQGPHRQKRSAAPTTQFQADALDAAGGDLAEFVPTLTEP